MRNPLATCVAAVCLGALVMGLGGCRPAMPYLGSPFAVSISRDAGFAQLTARAPLYWPGNEAVFDLTLRNDKDEPWRGRYCVELLGKEHPLVMIGQDDFVLQAGEPLTQELRYRLPNDLPYGVYGLALVIPGEISVTGNLPIGDTNEVLTGSWPKSSCW